MTGKRFGERLLFNISRFVSFFLVLSVSVTVTMLLFLRNMELDEGLIRENAPTAFAVIVILTLIGCGFDAFRRNQTIEKPLNQIIDALDRITQGDYTVRLDTNERDVDHAGFQKICERINRLAKELSGVETLRTDFIANVSHELKTPLAVVKNYTVLLRDQSLPQEKRAEYLDAISQTTQHLADLVTNILKLNKLENQQIFSEIVTFDLGEQICSCLLSFETAWESKGLELECDVADDIRVESDPELLQLVWSNLFSNAIKFTPNGGTISLKLVQDGEWACVSVSDTGCGMSPETGAHIFEKFYQGDTAHATQGNGLGLALVKRVVDITGGVISVSSTPGKGSTFTVRLRSVKNGTS